MNVSRVIGFSVFSIVIGALLNASGDNPFPFGLLVTLLVCALVGCAWTIHLHMSIEYEKIPNPDYRKPLIEKGSTVRWTTFMLGVLSVVITAVAFFIETASWTAAVFVMITILYCIANSAVGESLVSEIRSLE